MLYNIGRYCSFRLSSFKTGHMHPFNLYILIFSNVFCYVLGSPRVEDFIKGKGKVFYGQEPSSGESTKSECGVNYQLLAVITEVAQWGTPI